MTEKNVMEIIKIVGRAFARYGKNTPDNYERIKILAEDLIIRGFTAKTILLVLEKHAERSQFPPTIADVIIISKEIPSKDMNEFQARFRVQSIRSYGPWNMDDDIYTIKKIIGERRVDSATQFDFIEIEKLALDVFIKIKTGEIPLEKNRYRNPSQILLEAGNDNTPNDPNARMAKIKELLKDSAKLFDK